MKLNKDLSKKEIFNTIKVTSSSVISKFGDILFDYVNSVWLTGIHKGSFWLAIYQSSEIFVGIIFNFLGGVLSDLKNRKNILITCDLLSGVLCLLLGIFIPDKLFLYGIVGINILLAVLSSFRSPAYKAVFREIVEKKHIGKVNSILETFNEIIKILGPTLSLIVAHFTNDRLALIIDGLTFIFSSFILKNLAVVIKGFSKKTKITTFEQLKQGFVYLWANKDILAIITFASIANFIIAGYNLILPFSNYSFNTENIQPYAVFLTAESIGGLIGAASSTFFKDKLFQAKGLFILMLLSGLSLLPISILFRFTRSVFISSIGIFLFNLFLSIFNIRFMTFVQVKTNIEFIGRVFSIIFSVSVLFMPMGTFFFQYVLNVKNPNNYVILGTTLLILSLIAICVDKFARKEK